LHAKLLVVRILNELIGPLVMGGQGSGLRGFSLPVRVGLLLVTQHCRVGFSPAGQVFLLLPPQYPLVSHAEEKKRGSL
jgi:hypothetical protein